MRSLGIDTTGLPEKERTIRQGLRKKISAEMISRNELEGKPGAIPGLGPPDGVDSKWAIPIPYGVLSMIAEKIARGCEWNLKKRCVEHPYAVVTSIRKSEIAYPDYAAHLVEHLDFGPGCRIQRLSVPEEPNIVRYSITIWNALNLEAIVDLEDEIKKAEPAYSRPEGLDLSQMPAMRISPYLRDYQEHN